jgi:glycosyltransferase involved in cell wall biosynthesis
LTAIELDNTESVPVTYQPLLSVIVPVFNGSRKIGRTLENLQEKISQIETVMWNVEFQRSKKEGAILRGETTSTEGSTALAEQEEELLMLTGGGVATDNERTFQGAANVTVSRSSAPSTSLSMWYEVIAVNDGSKDDTRSILEKYSRNNEKVKLISYSKNMGKGYAIKQGVLHSTGKYILFMDGDGDVDPNILASYLKRLSEADIVIGSKNHPRSIVNAPASRKLLSKCFQTFVRVILDLKIRDTQVGLKVGRGDLFRKIFDKVLVRRYAFDAEMLAIANLLESKVVELPVKIDLDKSFKNKEIIKMALDVLGIAFRLRVIKWYQKNMEKQRPCYSTLGFA